jgi:hypothetical protein
MAVGNAAFEDVIHPVPGLTASEDLSTYQHCFVSMSGDGTVAHSAHNALPVGILLNKPTSGQACSIAGPGSVVKVKTTDTITAGYLLAPDASGNATAIHATTADYPAALAFVGGSTGDTLTCLLMGATKVL